MAVNEPIDDLKIFYKLVDKKPVACTVKEFFEWSKSEIFKNRRVAETIINNCWVSTVFLIIDHNLPGAMPQFFETMIFGGVHDRLIRRYTTYEEAEAGHLEMVKKVKCSIRQKE